MKLSIKESLAVNKSFWNERVSIHKNSSLYSLEDFRMGKNKLHELERSELGDIKGKKVLHLQCHFGMDTLSLEMLGAEVTGVDYSEEAIKSALELRDELGMKSEFILSDVLSLDRILKKKFDIVFTSYGVLIWLPDISKWGETVSYFLKDGGFLYMAEVHPASAMLTEKEGRLEVAYPYFKQEEPVIFNEAGTYADRNAKTINNTTHEWMYSLSDILMSLMNAGLNIEFFHEHNFTVWQQFDSMKKCGDGYYRIDKDIPLLFSLKAAKRSS